MDSEVSYLNRFSSYLTFMALVTFWSKIMGMAFLTSIRAISSCLHESYTWRNAYTLDHLHTVGNQSKPPDFPSPAHLLEGVHQHLPWTHVKAYRSGGSSRFQKPKSLSAFLLTVRMHMWDFLDLAWTTQNCTLKGEDFSEGKHCFGLSPSELLKPTFWALAEVFSRASTTRC